MLIVFKDNEIISIDKKLLSLLNIDFSKISEIISLLELNIKSLNQENINIFSNIFKITEIPLLSIENIKIFDLTLIEKSETLNQDYFSNELFIQNNLKESSPANNEVIISLDEDLISENEEIFINFEHEFNEISKIFSLNKQEINELINNDLLQTSKDLNLDIDLVKNFFNSLLIQLKENKKNFEEAIKEGNYEKIHKIAHSLKGAALNLRLSNLALILKTIDEYTKEKIPLEKIENLITQFYECINKIELQNLDNQELPKKEIPENIKQTIIQTIKNYLVTQNEKELKKDLKYISKLLNTKINSLDELKKIIENIK